MGLYHYRSQPIEGGVLVSCEEMDLASEKSTEAEAVAELKRALEERLRRPEAVGPPSKEPKVEVELRPLATRTREALEGPS